MTRPPYDYNDPEPSHLPPVAEARSRVLAFMFQWGDVEPLEGLHTRDLAALLTVPDAVEAVVREIWPDLGHGIHPALTAQTIPQRLLRAIGRDGAS